MSRKLNSAHKGAAEKVSARFDAALLAVIDREAERLSSLVGEECDRSKALRSIVRQFGSEGSSSAKPAREGKPRASAPVDAPPSATPVAPPVDVARNATVRESLSRALAARAMSVRAFCARYEVTRSTVQRFVNGGDLGPDALDKIASAVDALAASDAHTETNE